MESSFSLSVNLSVNLLFVHIVKIVLPDLCTFVVFRVESLQEPML